jgi:hypothetical protein
LKKGLASPRRRNATIVYFARAGVDLTRDVEEDGGGGACSDGI